jgi:hypothetical protein
VILGFGQFGLTNAVFAVGDTFVEVVAPERPDTTAGRYLGRRGGDGEYMAIFQVPDLAAARRRLDGLGVRVVWTADLPDIAATHLHPKDVPGAIVSLDWAAPAQSWRWAGPSWTGQAPEHSPGGVTGLTIEVNDPPAAARRWAAVLGIAVTGGGQGTVVELPDSGQWLRFVLARAARGEGIAAITIAGLAGGGPSIQISEGERASAGDVIVCRQNDGCVETDPGHKLTNGDVFQVERLAGNGAWVRRILGADSETGRRRLADHAFFYGGPKLRDVADLAYAVTGHKGMGGTVRAGSAYITGREPLEWLYVAMTRGQERKPRSRSPTTGSKTTTAPQWPSSPAQPTRAPAPAPTRNWRAESASSGNAPACHPNPPRPLADGERDRRSNGSHAPSHRSVR